MSEYLAQSQAFTATADAIRTKGNTSNTITWDENKGFADAVTSIPTGGTTPVQESDINFYDYDGTLLHAWSLAELQVKTELPELPTQPGLICQGWNWTLAALKGINRAMDVAAMYKTADGMTHIEIELTDGLLSPCLGFGVNGTATIDWGDGSATETLTGTSAFTPIFTPPHTYAAAGEYTIKILAPANGVLFHGESAASKMLVESATKAGFYSNKVKCIKLGANAGFYSYAVSNLNSLESVMLGTDLLMLSAYAIASAPRLDFVGLPSTLTSIPAACVNSSPVSRFVMPHSAQNVGGSQFISNIRVKICRLPECTEINGYMFYLASSINSLEVPGTVITIRDYAFSDMKNLEYLDFTRNASVPTLTTANAFTNIPAGCEIRVPASLLAEWKAATNWATYADHIVGV